MDKMKTKQSEIKEGSRIVYSDGRTGHTNVEAEVIEIEDRYMIVRFDDRASDTTIFFSDANWMNHISVK